MGSYRGVVGLYCCQLHGTKRERACTGRGTSPFHVEAKKGNGSFTANQTEFDKAKNATQDANVKEQELITKYVDDFKQLGRTQQTLLISNLTSTRL